MPEVSLVEKHEKIMFAMCVSLRKQFFLSNLSTVVTILMLTAFVFDLVTDRWMLAGLSAAAFCANIYLGWRIAGTTVDLLDVLIKAHFIAPFLMPSEKDKPINQ